MKKDIIMNKILQLAMLSCVATHISALPTLKIDLHKLNDNQVNVHSGELDLNNPLSPNQEIYFGDFVKGYWDGVKFSFTSTGEVQDLEVLSGEIPLSFSDFSARQCKICSSIVNISGESEIYKISFDESFKPVNLTIDGNLVSKIFNIPDHVIINGTLGILDNGKLISNRFSRITINGKLYSENDLTTESTSHESLFTITNNGEISANSGNVSFSVCTFCNSTSGKIVVNRLRLTKNHSFQNSGKLECNRLTIETNPDDWLPTSVFRQMGSCIIHELADVTCSSIYINATTRIKNLNFSLGCFPYSDLNIYNCNTTIENLSGRIDSLRVKNEADVVIENISSSIKSISCSDGGNLLIGNFFVETPLYGTLLFSAWGGNISVERAIIPSIIANSSVGDIHFENLNGHRITVHTRMRYSTFPAIRHNNTCHLI